jgi:hypothetical protein
MLRTIVAAIAAICTIGLIGAPLASAQPKFCENHGTGAGQTYIHACATGPGNGGSSIMIKNAEGNYVKVKHQDVISGKWKP